MKITIIQPGVRTRRPTNKERSPVSWETANARPPSMDAVPDTVKKPQISSGIKLSKRLEVSVSKLPSSATSTEQASEIFRKLKTVKKEKIGVSIK
jgi:hypothetical protein